MNLSSCRRLLAAVALAHASAAWAGLEWKSTSQSFELALGQEKLEAQFEFTNKGEQPVTINSVLTSCGCTAARLDKNTYAPGESGQIKVNFNAQGRYGMNHSTVTVITDEPPPASQTRLSMTINIPQVIQLQPIVLNWSLNEEPKAKEITAIVHPQAGFKLTGIATNEQGFSAAVLPVEGQPNTYRIQITPDDTQARRRATFLLRTDQPAGVWPSGPQNVFAFIR